MTCRYRLSVQVSDVADTPGHELLLIECDSTSCTVLTPRITTRSHEVAGWDLDARLIAALEDAAALAAEAECLDED